MEQSSSSTQQDEADFSLKEWGLKDKISRENTRSRRFSESNLKSFRENAMSFRSNITISSTASSPGYTLKGEIDPSTYSFTTALKALQAKTVYRWEYLSGDGLGLGLGLSLNSKWNDAEKYISNPLSGQVPLECLSTRALSGRSFRGARIITMSAPLIYPSPTHTHPGANSPISQHQTDQVVEVITSQLAEKRRKCRTRDVGTQSTPVDLSSSSPSPAPTPSTQERSIRMISEPEYGDSSISTQKFKSQTEVEVKETKEKQYTKTNGEGGRRRERKKQMIMSRCLCLSLRGLWMRTIFRLRHRHRDKHKPCHPN